jgi:Tfp pilus assembly protein PilE
MFIVEKRNYMKRASRNDAHICILCIQSVSERTFSGNGPSTTSKQRASDQSHRNSLALLKVCGRCFEYENVYHLHTTSFSWFSLSM